MLAVRTTGHLAECGTPWALDGLNTLLQGESMKTGDLNHSKKVTELGQMIGQNGGSIINNTDGLDEINGLERWPSCRFQPITCVFCFAKCHHDHRQDASQIKKSPRVVRQIFAHPGDCFVKKIN